MQREKEPVTKEMVIGEILEKHPGSAKIMMKHGMHCIGCHVATWETIEQAATAHGINIAQLLKELNKRN
ncbi:DUF1858 domain-containing protein [Candidatus Woesearchaeota archaeon]|nr:DUF1858 domain-containing protein [Candidatus Woesearchaeota archaeon]